jgi:hypothetical protein
MSFLIPFDMDKVERANLRKILSQNKPKISNVNFDRANRKLLVTYTDGSEQDLEVGLDMQNINEIIGILKQRGISEEAIEDLLKEMNTNKDSIIDLVSQQVEQKTHIGSNKETITELTKFINTMTIEFNNQVGQLENEIKLLQPGESDAQIQIDIQNLKKTINDINIPEFNLDPINVKITSLETELKAIKDRRVVERIDIGTEADVVVGKPFSKEQSTKYLTQHGGTALDSLYRKWLAQ